MPAPRSREAPRFKGKYIKEFLDEFETLAKAAGISDKERCHYLARYCREDKKHFDHKRFVKSLQEYQEENWPELKKTLELSYPPEEEEFSVTVKALNRFVVKTRSISDLAGFDEYYRNFVLLANLLVKKNKISTEDRNHYFFHGIQPYSLRKQIRDKMERDKTWDDPEIAPEMSKVTETAQKLLKKSRYNIKKFENVTKELSISSDDDSNSSNSDSSSTSESEEDEARDINSHRRYVKKSLRAKETKSETKTTSEQSKPVPDTATDEVTSRLDRLTIALERQLDVLANINALVQPAASAPAPAPAQSRVCYMCGKPEAHGMKECPETIAFLAAGIVKVNSEGRIIRSNGNPLPRGIPGAGGIAQILKDEAMTKRSTTSSLEIDREPFLTANYEYARLSKDKAEYEVMPALRSGKTSDERTQPYKRPENSQQAKRQSKPEVVITKPKAPAERPFVPTILKRKVELPPAEDIEMSEDVEKTPTPMPEPSASRAPKEKSENEKGKSKVSFEDTESVNPKDKSITKSKRASPAFKFSSDVQESVDHDRLVEKVLDAPINISLREFMSTFEVSKRVQAITKTQKIPIAHSSDPKTPRRAFTATVEDVTDEEEGPPVVYIRTICADLPDRADLDLDLANQDPADRLQLLKNGDREDQITIPIVHSPCNAYPTSVQKAYPRSYPADPSNIDISRCAEVTTTPFALHTSESRLSTCESADLSLNMCQGRVQLSPRIGKSLVSTFENPRIDVTKYGPLHRKANRVNNSSVPIYEALKRMCLTNISDNSRSIEGRMRAIGLANEHKGHGANIIAREFLHRITNTNAILAVILVSARDSDLVTRGHMLATPMNSRKIEDFVRMKDKFEEVGVIRELQPARLVTIPDEPRDYITFGLRARLSKAFKLKNCVLSMKQISEKALQKIRKMVKVEKRALSSRTRGK